MARNTINRRVTLNDNNTMRSEKTGAPAVESENARVEQVGVWRKANVPISQSGVAMLFGGGVDSDEGTKFIAGRAGHVVGVVWQLTAAATHTAGSIQPAVGPAGGTLAAQGASVAIDGGGTAAVVDQNGAAPDNLGVPFNEGDDLGVLLTTDAAWLPTTTDLQVWLMVRWAAGGTPTG